MKTDFLRPDISYTPLRVEASDAIDITKNERSAEEKETVAIAEKLMKHLSIIQSYNERIEAIDYLINNAKKLSGNLKYTTEDQAIIASIKAMGGDGNTVDFSLFEKSVDAIIQEYRNMTIIAMSGARSI